MQSASSYCGGVVFRESDAAAIQTHR